MIKKNLVQLCFHIRKTLISLHFDSENFQHSLLFNLGITKKNLDL